MYIINPHKRHVINYNRKKAVEYAHKWAFNRNPKYYDFSNIGGDCTNFASQVIFAGSKVMNYSTKAGWYYININNRAPSWTDVDLLYNFLTTNISKGPFGEEVNIENVKPGDIVQLAFDEVNNFNHSPIIIQTGTFPSIDNLLIAAHTIDRDYYPLSNYEWKYIRFIHIKNIYI